MSLVVTLSNASVTSVTDENGNAVDFSVNADSSPIKITIAASADVPVVEVVEETVVEPAPAAEAPTAEVPAPAAPVEEAPAADPTVEGTPPTDVPVEPAVEPTAV